MGEETEERYIQQERWRGTDRGDGLMERDRGEHAREEREKEGERKGKGRRRVKGREEVDIREEA